MEVRKISLTVITTDELQGREVKGMCSYCGNNQGSDEYFILVNGKCSDDEQALSFLHEMLHAYHEDHKLKNTDVRQLEKDRNSELVRLLKLAVASEGMETAVANG